MVANNWNIPLDHPNYRGRAAQNKKSIIANDINRDKDSDFSLKSTFTRYPLRNGDSDDRW